MVVSGIGVNEGSVFGRAFVFRHSELTVDHSPIDECDAEYQKGLFLKAKDELVDEYNRIVRDKSGSERDILDAQLGFLIDPEFQDSIMDYILNHRHSASWAVEAAGNNLIAPLEGSENEYLRERATELNELKARLISKITGKSSELSLESEAIVVADYLLVTEFLGSDISKIKGIALDSGGKTSHIAILAKAFNIPIVVGLEDLSKRCMSGEEIILNAYDGEVTIDANKDDISYFKSLKKREREHQRLLNREASRPSVTTDNKRIFIKANVEGLNGIDTAILSGADGVGLFRTEFLFLRKEFLSDEKKTEEIYMEAAERMEGYGPVTFRTLDIGGDKAVDGIDAEGSEHSLGMRSIRFCMENREVFHSQLVSILKASKGHNAEIMFPMISSRDELLEVLDYFESVKRECREREIDFDENIKVGTMIEVPSAALTVDLIAPLVDFISVGTNDLIQFTIALDRGKDALSYLYEPLHPALIRLLKSIVENGKRAGVRVEICGEMASDMEYLPLLIGLGFDELSISAHSILEAKRRVRDLSYSECRGLVDRILEKSEIKEIKKELRDFNNERGS